MISEQHDEVQTLVCVLSLLLKNVSELTLFEMFCFHAHI